MAPCCASKLVPGCQVLTIPEWLTDASSPPTASSLASGASFESPPSFSAFPWGLTADGLVTAPAAGSLSGSRAESVPRFQGPSSSNTRSSRNVFSMRSWCCRSRCYCCCRQRTGSPLVHLALSCLDMLLLLGLPEKVCVTLWRLIRRPHPHLRTAPSQSHTHTHLRQLQPNLPTTLHPFPLPGLLGFRFGLTAFFAISRRPSSCTNQCQLGQVSYRTYQLTTRETSLKDFLSPFSRSSDISRVASRSSPSHLHPYFFSPGHRHYRRKNTRRTSCLNSPPWHRKSAVSRSCCLTSVSLHLPASTHFRTWMDLFCS